MERLRRPLKFKALPSALKILLIYACLSLALSLFILLRFWTGSVYVKWINVALYFLTYYVLPAAAFFWFYRFLPLLKDPRRRHVAKAYSLAVAASFGYLLMILLPVYGLPSLVPDYAFFWMPVPLMVLAYAKRAVKAVWSRKVMVVLLVVAVLMPNLAAFAGLNGELNAASSIAGDSGRASYISQRIRDTELPTWFMRAHNDFWKFLMAGSGQCGEMSTATVSYLYRLGIEARKVGRPGENHEFVEVKLHGSWWVVDPGYYGGDFLSRRERASKRIEDVGAISYVAAYVDSSFVELTQEYVSTDAVTIRVLREGEPFADAQIILTHRFQGNDWSLPPLYTDGNGTATLHLGALNFNSNAGEAESFFRIYVNGQSTGRNVTSTGTGILQRVEIDLSGGRVVDSLSAK